MLLNAGVLGEIKDLSDTTLAEIAAVMDVNVWANKVIYDTLRELDTRIQQLVAISSGAAFNGSGGWGAYSMSKSALNLMFRVYAHEISRGEDEVGTGMSAYRGADGWVIWEKPDFSYFGPCILHNDTVITNATMYKATFWKSQGAFSLLDGSPVTIANPLTGKLQPWCFSRTNGCGTAVAAEHMLTFRAGAAGLYDLQAHSGTGNFGGFRRPAFMTCKRIPAPGTSVVSGGRR